MKNDNLSAVYERISKIIAEYQPDIQNYLQTFRSRVTHEQYGLGGENLYRGYYCPSLITDLVAGNGNRGRLSKQKPTEKHPPFTFGFDGENNLILVECPAGWEIIFRRDDGEIGIVVAEDGMIQAVSYCRFDGARPSSCAFCVYDGYAQRIVELTEEIYCYRESELQVDWKRQFTFRNKQMVQQEQYTFLIENGYLSSYQMQEFDENGRKEGVWDNRSFPVRLKRKVPESPGMIHLS